MNLFFFVKVTKVLFVFPTHLVWEFVKSSYFLDFYHHLVFRCTGDAWNVRKFGALAVEVVFAAENRPQWFRSGGGCQYR